MSKLEILMQKYCKKTEISKDEYMAAKQSMDTESFKTQYTWSPGAEAGDRYYKYSNYVAEDAMLLFMEDIRMELEETKRYARNTWYFAVAIIVINILIFFIGLL